MRGGGNGFLAFFRHVMATLFDRLLTPGVDDEPLRLIRFGGTNRSQSFRSNAKPDLSPLPRYCFMTLHGIQIPFIFHPLILNSDPYQKRILLKLSHGARSVMAVAVGGRFGSMKHIEHIVRVSSHNKLSP